VATEKAMEIVAEAAGFSVVERVEYEPAEFQFHDQQRSTCPLAEACALPGPFGERLCPMIARDNIGSLPPSTDIRWTFLKVAVVPVAATLFGLMIVLGYFPSIRLSVLVLLIASGGFLLVKGRGSRDLLHPVRVFGALWCFCLALASMRLIPIISSWSYLTWSCFLTGLASFTGGVWLADRFSRPRDISRGPRREEEEPATSLLTDRKALTVAWLSVAVGAAVLAYEYHLTGTIPILQTIRMKHGRDCSVLQG